MVLKILHSPGLRAAVIAMVLLGTGFMVFAQPTAAQGGRTEIVIGLQNDMTTLDYFNPETNTVWNAYQVGYGFEGLFGSDPDNHVFPILANPLKGASGPGFSFIGPPTAAQPVVDVYVRPGVTFHDGQPMTVADVVFSYQVLAWSTYQTYVTSPLWWIAPQWPHWTGGGNVSHIGVEVSPAAPDAVRFHLYKPYALFFLATLGIPIIPKHIWGVPWPAHIDYSQQPLNISSLTRITDSNDYSGNFAFGNRPTEIGATVGTGIFKFDSWTPNAGSHVSTYAGYWGKGLTMATWGGVTFPFFPEHLQSIHFVIFTSLDVISLALQKGEVDTLIWSLTPGFLTQVRFNPSISVEQVTDAGYFYLAFNLRRKPWNDLVVREAISMAIDKDYIVNTLMGGFGIKGTVPISVHTPGYINASAAPPSFDLAGARALLDAHGIIDRNGDGFREYSDGSPIRATILTPPKDYDPIRADSGIMISNNLKAIGLNIDSAPTSFDTIVSKAFTEVDFDIYILGFLLTGTPETYLKDFFGSSNDVAINPAGSNSAGYKNPTVDALLDRMETTLDDSTRIQIVKDIEGIVTNDIPWNILYYRKNLNAYRNDAWVGWINTPPQLYNIWSLVKIRPAGAVVVPPPSGVFSVALTVPERALGGHTVNVDAFVAQNLAPVSGATVTLNASFGSLFRTMSATTDVSGHARFAWIVPVIQGDLTLTAIATKGTSTATTVKRLEITVGPPAPIATLTLSTTTPVIGTGGTATIVAKVIDGLGAGIPGVTVSVDRTLVIGGVSPASGVTDATGSLTFTYSAPATAALFPNQQLSDFLKFTASVSDTVAVDTQAQSIVIFVENDNTPNWVIVDIQATDLVLNTLLAGDFTTITAKATGFDGLPRSGVFIEPVLPASESGIANVTVTPANGTTDAGGLVTFTVTETAAAVPGNIPIRFRAPQASYETSDVAGLLLTNLVTPGYAALLDFSDRSITSSPAQTTTVTATVWDQLGNPATDAAVIFQIKAGPTGLPAQFPWAYDYSKPEYLGSGLDLNYFDFGGSFGPSFQNSSGQGTGYGVEHLVEDAELVGNFPAVDSCNPSTWPSDFGGYYLLNATGQLTGTIKPMPHKSDQPVQVRAFIGSTSPVNRLRLNATVCSGFVGTFFGWSVADSSYTIDSGIENAAFVIDSGIVVQRAPVIALGSASVSAPGEIFASDGRTQTITAKFYARDGAPAANAKVFLLRGFGTTARNVLGGFGGTHTTDATGTVSWTVTVPLLTLSQAHYFSFLTADERYAFGGREQLFSGNGDNWGDFYLNQFLFVVLSKLPLVVVRGYLYVPTSVAFASVSVDKTLVPEDGTATATVTVTDGGGSPIANATVWSGPIQTLTDASGHASFSFSAGSGAVENLAVVTTPDKSQVTRAWYGILASAPVLSYASLAVAKDFAGSVSTITLTVTNQLAVAGPATVVLLVNGQAVDAQVVNLAASGSATVTFKHVFDTAGTYAVAVGDQTASTTIDPRPQDLTVYAVGGGLLVVGLALGAVVGLMMSRRRKRPPAMEMGKEETRPSEEELPPEENL
jgi:ABC-type transport system substrate-binding protein